MRQPVMKLSDAQMRTMRDALVRSGYDIPDLPLGQFYTGRNEA